jgi:hypothetical protein
VIGHPLKGLVSAVVLMVVVCGPAGPGARAQTPGQVDLELALAVDASASVNRQEFDLQMKGLARAFESPAVISAIKDGPKGVIAVVLIEWSGADEQRVSVPWMLVSDAGSGRRFAAAIDNTPRSFRRGSTSISGAIDFALASLLGNGIAAGRSVIDISGDGRNTHGGIVDIARDRAVQAGVTINGLPILNEEPDLVEHYRDNVIGGPGAFVVPAKDYRVFGSAIVEKLVREISGKWYGVWAPGDGNGPELPIIPAKSIQKLVQNREKYGNSPKATLW